MAICPVYPYAQTADSTALSADTIPAEQHRRSKTAEIIGIAAPSAMILYGALSFKVEGIRQLDYSVRNELLENNSIWHNRWDDYLQYSPAVAAFGLKLCGMKSMHGWRDMAILYAASNLLAGGVVYRTKTLTGRERPDSSNNYSFPSGHTGTAFVAAEFLHQEYKNESVWISVGGYGMATLVGVSRIYRNKHWVSDVAAGAGIGILSTKIIYRTYLYLQKTFCKRGRKLNAFIVPSYNDGAWGLSFAYIHR